LAFTPQFISDLCFGIRTLEKKLKTLTRTHQSLLRYVLFIALFYTIAVKIKKNRFLHIYNTLNKQQLFTLNRGSMPIKIFWRSYPISTIVLFRPVGLCSAMAYLVVG